MFGAETRREIVIGLRAVDVNLKKQLREAQKHTLSVGKVGQEASRQVAEVQQKVYENSQKIKQAMGKSTKEFAGWALSIMFFGMALKQVFNTIWRSSTKTFQDVMHSVEGTVTQFDMLDGSMKYLQYTAGAALEPLAALLLPIVDSLSDWISNNQDVFRTFTLVTGVLGTLFTVGGMGVLAINGFADLAMKIGLASTNADGLLKVDWSKIGSAIQKGIGGVAIAWSVVQAVDAFKEFNDGKWVSGFGDAVSAGLKGWAGLTFLKGGKGSFGKGTLLISAAIAIDEALNGRLITDIMKVAGLLTSLFYTIGKYIGWLFSTGFIESVQKYVTVWVNSNAWLLDLLGIDFKLTEPESSAGFDFAGTFKEIYAAQLATAKQWDAVIKEFVDAGDVLSSNINRAADTLNGAQLLNPEELNTLLSGTSQATTDLIARLLSYDNVYDSLVSDRDQSSLLQHYNQVTGQPVYIQEVNVTTNDLQTLLAQIQALQG